MKKKKKVSHIQGKKRKKILSCQNFFLYLEIILKKIKHFEERKQLACQNFFENLVSYMKRKNTDFKI